MSERRVTQTQTLTRTKTETHQKIDKHAGKEANTNRKTKRGDFNKVVRLWQNKKDDSIKLFMSNQFRPDKIIQIFPSLKFFQY